MSSLKEQITADVDVFLSGDEFAETHTVNGVQMTAIREGLTTKDMLLSRKNGAEFDGVHGKTVVLHVRTRDLPQTVVHGNTVDVDGGIYLVEDSVDDMGITTLTLEVNTI